jgi:hypothetical protein
MDTFSSNQPRPCQMPSGIAAPSSRIRAMSRWYDSRTDGESGVDLAGLSRWVISTKGPGRGDDEIRGGVRPRHHRHVRGGGASGPTTAE